MVRSSWFCSAAGGKTGAPLFKASFAAAIAVHYGVGDTESRYTHWAATTTGFRAGKYGALSPGRNAPNSCRQRELRNSISGGTFAVAVKPLVYSNARRKQGEKRISRILHRVTFAAQIVYGTRPRVREKPVDNQGQCSYCILP
jgi:hypothetical protein